MQQTNMKKQTTRLKRIIIFRRAARTRPYGMCGSVRFMNDSTRARMKYYVSAHIHTHTHTHSRINKRKYSVRIMMCACTMYMMLYTD